MFYLFSIIFLLFYGLDIIEAKNKTETTTAKTENETTTAAPTTKEATEATFVTKPHKPHSNTIKADVIVTTPAETVKTEIVTTPPTTTEAWSTPRILGLSVSRSQKQRKGKKKKKEECHGWCFEGKNFTIHLKIVVDPAEDKKKRSRLYMVKSAVDKYAKFPVRLAVNVYADKNQYADKMRSRSRTKLFEKNLIQVPTGIFFPYTRNAVRKAIYDSGHIYVPHQRRQTAMISRAISHPFDETPLTFLMSDQRFTNDYFETNPLLSSSTHFKTVRRNSVGLPEYLVSSDPFNIGADKSAERDVVNNNDANDDGYRRRRGMVSMRSVKLKEFLGTGNRMRADKHSSPSEIKKILGTKAEESMLQNSRATVDDVVGGMKLNSKSNLFLYGVTKSARSNIIKWVGKRNRAGKLGNVRDTGVVVNGKARSRVINEVLRSMITNYQYGERKPVYKKITDLH